MLTQDTLFLVQNQTGMLELVHKAYRYDTRTTKFTGQ